MSKEIEYFRTKPDSIDPVDMAFTLRVIRHNPETDANELILHKHKPGTNGERVTDTITFDDPGTLDCAVGQLEEIGTAVVVGMGSIRHEHHLWDIGEYDENSEDIIEDEVTRGIITCVLHIKNGVLAPCTPKILPVNKV